MPEPFSEAFDMFEGRCDKTDEQVSERLVRIRSLIQSQDPELTTYVLYEGVVGGGIGFMPTPVPFSNLWIIEGARLVWACQAKDWDSANQLYHEFMGWRPYKPMER